MNNSIPNLLTTLTTAVLAAVIGAWMTNEATKDVWRRDVLFKVQRETFDKRVDALKEMNAILSESQRLVVMQLRSSTASGNPITNILYCLDLKQRTLTFSDECKMDVTDQQAATAFNEVVSLQSRFYAARATANVYFCEATQHALKKFPDGPWWWNADSESKRLLLTAMEEDIMCGINLKNVFK
jgi:hypothetical protein